MRAVIFSRDRATQLDLLLRSLERNAVALDLAPVVLWTATSPVYERAYELVASEHSALFIREDGLTYQVRSLLRDEELVVFFTDDDVLFAPIDEESARALDDPAIASFSLRLGRNTTTCYPHRAAQRLPRCTEYRERLIWSWQVADGDFGYPLSLDGHVLRAGDIRALLGDDHFSNPNSLEGLLARRADQLFRPLMASYERSALVSIPANRVTDTDGNRHGDLHPRDVGELNDRFLAGERLDLAAMDFSAVDGAHTELELRFVAKEAA